MTGNSQCSACVAFGPFCAGSAEGNVRCQNLASWVDVLGGPSASPFDSAQDKLRTGLDLDMPLAPQPEFELPSFFPQLLNGLEVSSMLAREQVVGVGIAKALTPRGRVSRRALPVAFGPHSLRAQWGLGERSLLLCVSNYLDDYLERLWIAQSQENIWGRLQALGFDAATSLNFSIYFDRPRLEHLVNIKRSWLTVHQIQEASTLIPIPHLQWATLLDLERQLDYAREQGFHTLTLNLQMIKRKGWDTVAVGIPTIQASGLRLLFTGVTSLKRLGELAKAFPNASFTNTTVHYLAQRGIRLQRDDTRLIEEPVVGHPDIILAENVALYRAFVAEVRGSGAA